MNLDLMTKSLEKSFEELDNAKTKKEVKAAVDKSKAKSVLAKQINSTLKLRIEAIKAIKSGQVHISNLDKVLGIELTK